MTTIVQTIVGPLRLVEHKPIPTNFADKQAALIARHGWPWMNIPPLYRRSGRPDEAIMAKVRPALAPAHPEPRLRIVTFTGTVGTGKSSVACQLAAAMASEWFSPWGPDDNPMRPDSNAVGYQTCIGLGWLDQDMMPLLIEYPILVLDDLSGALTMAGITRAQQIIEGRISHRRRTLITTTLSIEDIGRREMELNGGRELGLASRLAGGCEVEMTGEDRRLTLGDDARSRQMSDP